MSADQNTLGKWVGRLLTFQTYDVNDIKIYLTLERDLDTSFDRKICSEMIHRVLSGMSDQTLAVRLSNVPYVPCRLSMMQHLTISSDFHLETLYPFLFKTKTLTWVKIENNTLTNEQLLKFFSELAKTNNRWINFLSIRSQSVTQQGFEEIVPFLNSYNCGTLDLNINADLFWLLPNFLNNPEPKHAQRKISLKNGQVCVSIGSVIFEGKPDAFLEINSEEFKFILSFLDKSKFDSIELIHLAIINMRLSDEQIEFLIANHLDEVDVVDENVQQPGDKITHLFFENIGYNSLKSAYLIRGMTPVLSHLIPVKGLHKTIFEYCGLKPENLQIALTENNSSSASRANRTKDTEEEMEIAKAPQNPVSASVPVSQRIANIEQSLSKSPAPQTKKPVTFNKNSRDKKEDTERKETKELKQTPAKKPVAIPKPSSVKQLIRKFGS